MKILLVILIYSLIVGLVASLWYTIDHKYLDKSADFEDVIGPAVFWPLTFFPYTIFLLTKIKVDR